MKKDPNVFLGHILDSIELVEDYTKGISKKKFMDSISDQDRIIRRMEVIGEAVRNLDENFRSENPKVVWKKIVGMRDKLIHAYFDVDLQLVWEVIRKDLPILKKQIQKIISKN